MPVFGEYESTEELYRHGLGFVARARRISGADAGKGPHVVKVLQPSLRVASPETLRAASQSFLQRCRLQASVASQSPRWARVHASGNGPTPDAAFFISDYCPRSLQNLISCRVQLSSAAMYSIINSIVQGLIDLRKTTVRPHGGIRPSNVLLAGSTEPDRAKVLLTDLAPLSQSAMDLDGGGVAEESDLLAVGGIIFELVLHRPFAGIQSYPAPDSPEWMQLGSKGEAWREFCNELLQPGGQQPMTLGAAAKRLESLRVRRNSFTPGRITTVATAAVVVAGTAGTLKYIDYARDWRKFCNANAQWLYQFQLDLRSDPQRLARLEQDPALRKVLEDVASDDDLDPKRVSGEEGMLVSELANHPPLNINAIRKTGPALAIIHSLQNTLRPDEWPTLKEVDTARQRFAQRGWTNAASTLSQLEDGIAPGPNMVAGIDRLLKAQAGLSDDLALIEDRWQSVSTTTDLVHHNAPDDAVLGQFEAFAQKYAAQSAAPNISGLGDLREALLPLKKTADELAVVLQSDWSERIDRKRLADEAPVYKLPGPLSEAAFHEWLQEVQGYYIYHPVETDAAIAALNAAATDADAKIGAIPNNFAAYASAVGELKQRLTSAKERINRELANQSWVQKDRQTDVIATRRDAIAQAIREVADDAQQVQALHTIDQKQWWDSFVASNVAADSPSLQQAWQQWRLRLPGGNRDQMPLNMADFEALRTAAQQWKEALAAADKRFTPPAGLEEPYGSLVHDKREANIQAAIAAAGSDGKPDLAAFNAEIQRRADRYAKWCQDISPLVQAFQQSAVQLDAGFSPTDDPTQALAKLLTYKDHPAWPDVSAQSQPKSVLDRLDALARVASLSRGDLSGLATASTTKPEVVLAAWRALSATKPSGPNNPPWPGEIDELSQELTIRQNVGELAGRQKDHFREQRIRDELRNSAPAMIAAFANNDRPATQLPAAYDAAVRAATTLGVASSDPATPLNRCQQLAAAVPLLPWVHYNFLLCGLREQASESSGADRESVLNAVADFRAEVNKFPNDIRRRSAVAGLLSQLEHLKDPDPPHGPAAPWSSQMLSNGIEAFTRSDSGSAVTLRFARVQPKDGPAAFVCTTELSFSDFVSVAPSRDAALMKQLLIDYVPGSDPRPGPRVWDREDQASRTGEVLSQPESWLRPHDDDRWDYPAAFRDKQSPFNNSSLDASFGGNPLHRPHLPMNYLPAPTAMYVAGLVGCRLPTSAEWAAAYAQTQKRGHLRGTTWQIQQAHIASNGGRPEWPDAGIFWPKDYPAERKTGAAAQAYNLTDSTLFFTDTEADGEPIFHNLVGNLAEFIFNNPTALDRLGDKSFGGVQSLLEQNADKLFVIGGSALSPPELPTDTPLPVDLRRGGPLPNAWSGFADVGMRLAFQAPRAPAEQLAAILSTAEFQQRVEVRPAPHASAIETSRAILAADLPSRPPAWSRQLLLGAGTADGKGGKAKSERAAESAAVADLRAKIYALPLSSTTTVGDAAKGSPTIAQAIERCLARAYPYKVEYQADGGVSIKSTMDSRELWSEIASAEPTR